MKKVPDSSGVRFGVALTTAVPCGVLKRISSHRCRGHVSFAQDRLGAAAFRAVLGALLELVFTIEYKEKALASPPSAGQVSHSVSITNSKHHFQPSSNVLKLVTDFPINYMFPCSLVKFWLTEFLCSAPMDSMCRSVPVAYGPTNTLLRRNC